MSNVLFVWSNMNTLKRYGRGQVIAYGNSIEEARALAIAIFTDEQKKMYNDPEFYMDSVVDFANEIKNSEPKVFETLTAIILWGSE